MTHHDKRPQEDKVEHVKLMNKIKNEVLKSNESARNLPCKTVKKYRFKT